MRHRFIGGLIAEFIGALTKRVQQSNILDRDVCLVAKGLDQRNLLVRKRSNLQTIDRYHAEQIVALEYRYAED